ncbi:GAF and ANTAR domain-containing protein [Streptomyces avidinii]|uniref:Transcriptional regulator with GAF, ATPase, and Fis domain n=1 Tax=Streptomyces avidinii TaxID=1895 RepID=A0ABS4KY15_STRAV|nr:GAF and ANTAR domain-containing protein [Streptomyces avidinii]MBP2034930.1 transcriptional regulator with GAF, ATPase, and Fis domain [Streptomyces avidinii]
MNTRERQLTEAFVALSDTLADEVDALVLLGRLTRHSVALTRIDAAGVMLVNSRGHLRPAIATEHTLELTEMWQAQIRQGPCIDAFNQGIPVHADDLEADRDRWPDFVPLALTAGYRSAHAVPLIAQCQTIGALNLLVGRPTPLDEAETHLLRALADVATTALMTWKKDGLRSEDIVTSTQAVLSGKAVFDTATGMLAATADITPAQAARHLSAFADRHHQRPTEIAADIVQRRITPQAVLGELS